MRYESPSGGGEPRPFNRKTDWRRHARDGNPDGPLFGETIVFTDALSIARDSAAQMASVAGSKISDSVTKKTTVRVFGDQDLRLTKGQEKSSKHRKAEAMIEDGAAIRIVRESDFMMMVEYDKL